ncbi:MAG: outer membrane beta-barrel protein [Bdellovibrionota bacterium]
MSSNCLRKISVIVVVMMTVMTASADSIRVGADLGFGQGMLESDGSSFEEGPGAFSAYGEYALNSKLLLGVHHLRTVEQDDGEISTAISFTGLTARWFPLAPVQQVRAKSAGRAVMSGSSFSPFVLGAFGLGQSSIRAKNFDERGKGTSVGSYVGVQGGVEYPLTGALGLTFQAGYYRTLIGTGNLSLLSTTAGLYLFF